MRIGAGADGTPATHCMGSWLVGRRVRLVITAPVSCL